MVNWKPNWNETRKNFIEWWNHDGFVLTVGTHPLETPREEFGDIRESSMVEAYEDGPGRARRNHAWLATQAFPGDSLPISNTDIGPGSLALALGSQPGFSSETVWFEPCIHMAEAEQALDIAAAYR